MTDHTLNGEQSQETASLEPLNQAPLPIAKQKRGKPKRGKEFDARKAMREYLWENPHFYSDEQILNALRWVFDRDNTDALKFIRHVVSRDSSVFFRRPADGKITIIKNLNRRRLAPDEGLETAPAGGSVSEPRPTALG